MPHEETDNERILSSLRQEFIEMARDQLEDIEEKLEFIRKDQGGSEEELFSIQRHIHNIKGQGATFGFPLTGRVAHMLEDYLKNVNGLEADNINDIEAFLSLMVDLISSGEAIAEDDPQSLLNALPTGQVAAFSAQKTNVIKVLLVMPPGVQRKLVARELLSCGFQVIRAYDSIEALSVAIDLKPEIVFLNYGIRPINGCEMSNMFAAVEMLRDIHIVLLTSLNENDEKLQGLASNVSVVEKNSDFTVDIGELLIEWKVFGNTMVGE